MSATFGLVAPATRFPPRLSGEKENAASHSASASLLSRLAKFARSKWHHVDNPSPPSPSDCCICLFPIASSEEDDADTPPPPLRPALTCSSHHVLCTDCVPQYVKSTLQETDRLQKSGFKLTCPIPGCNASPFKFKAIRESLGVENADSLDLISDALASHAASSTSSKTSSLTQNIDCKTLRAALLSSLNLCCPNPLCSVPIIRSDGCAAMRCACKHGVCDFCLQAFPPSLSSSDLHSHVSQCEENPNKGDLFATATEPHRRRRIENLRYELFLALKGGTLKGNAAARAALKDIDRELKGVGLTVDAVLENDALSVRKLGVGPRRLAVRNGPGHVQYEAPTLFERACACKDAIGLSFIVLGFFVSLCYFDNVHVASTLSTFGFSIINVRTPFALARNRYEKTKEILVTILMLVMAQLVFSAVYLIVQKVFAVGVIPFIGKSIRLFGYSVLGIAKVLLWACLSIVKGLLSGGLTIAKGLLWIVNCALQFFWVFLKGSFGAYAPLAAIFLGIYVLRNARFDAELSLGGILSWCVQFVLAIGLVTICMIFVSIFVEILVKGVD